MSDNLVINKCTCMRHVNIPIPTTQSKRKWLEWREGFSPTNGNERYNFTAEEGLLRLEWLLFVFLHVHDIDVLMGIFIILVPTYSYSIF